MSRGITNPELQPPEPEGPRQVSKFEFSLLSILRFLLGHFPTDQGMKLMRQPLTRPECLHETAVDLVKDTLAKAVVLFLVRQGGWRNDRYLRDGRPTPGRVWERIPLEERTLTFSRPVLEFLIWATAEKVNETKVFWDSAPAALSPADELFFCLAYDSVRSDPDLLAVLRRKKAFRLNPLCWISFPGDMVADDEDPDVPDFAPLFQGQRAVILECLQRHLENRWLRSEQAKGQISDWKKMRSRGRAELAALEAYLKAAEAANRTDLARFILRTNATLFATEMSPVFWTGGLQGSGPARLADRLDTQRVALAVPRQMAVLETWQARARGVGYFDDEYPASQMWKAEWEAANGDVVAARARATIQMLEPLRGSPTGLSSKGDGRQKASDIAADSPH
jgi:hypothetical protein